MSLTTTVPLGKYGYTLHAPPNEAALLPGTVSKKATSVSSASERSPISSTRRPLW